MSSTHEHPDATATRTERADARANRLRVLQAAREVLAEQGLGAEMRDIADRADVGLATIYRAFGNKEGLLRAMAQQGAADVLDLLAAAESAADPVRGLHDFLVGAVRYVDAHAALFDLLAGHFAFEGEEMHVQLSSRFSRLIERCLQSRRSGAALSVDVLTHLILGSLITRAHSRDLAPVPDADEFAGTVMRLLT